jgi:hypothetical protein
MASTPTPAFPVRSGHLPINDLQMYYEVHCAGAPLILLHGQFLDSPA